jgi:hypothetical protein
MRVDFCKRRRLSEKLQLPPSHQTFIALRADPLTAIRAAIFLVSPPLGAGAHENNAAGNAGQEKKYFSGVGEAKPAYESLLSGSPGMFVTIYAQLQRLMTVLSRY